MKIAIVGAGIIGATTAYELAHDGHEVTVLERSGSSLEGRGAGVELRLYGCDPDAAEPRARALGYTVLAGSMDKPHGLRECVLIDDDGYAWEPGMALKAG